jgi:ribosomal-protein-alanine N-acetyltransferase
MQLLTERLFLIPLQPDGMRALLDRTTDPELVGPYTEMLTLSPAPGAVDLVHGLGPLPERFR